LERTTRFLQSLIPHRFSFFLTYRQNAFTSTPSHVVKSSFRSSDSECRNCPQSSRRRRQKSIECREIRSLASILNRREVERIHAYDPYQERSGRCRGPL